MKKCIFYLPYELDQKAARARMVRPRRIIQAFEEIGYEVFTITGFASERKKKIAELKHKISAGTRFEFMYTETSTMPMMLTEPHHFPTHPFLDFGFFRYVKKQGIPIGLFYPDIYWKFEDYAENAPSWKRFAALKCYELDIHEYEKYLDRFYVPTLKACEFLQSPRLMDIAEELPPGAEDLTISHKSYADRDFAIQPLTIIFVGGLGVHYHIEELISAVLQTPNTRLILCCREADWKAEKDQHEASLCERVEVIHKTTEELEPYYSQADICALAFKKDIYMEMSKPVKAFEYLAHEIPMLATVGTAMGDYVEEKEIGWTIDYSCEAIKQQFISIIEDPRILEEMQKHCREEKRHNTWKARAEKVANELRAKGRHIT